MAINNVVLMGRLVAAPELKTTQSGVSVCNFTIAVDRNYKEKIADFIDCVTWRSSADFVTKFFSKGDLIALVGSLQTDTWEDDAGKKRKSTKVIVNSVSFAGGGRKSQSSEGNNTEATSEATPDYEVIGDDIPF